MTAKLTGLAHIGIFTPDFEKSVAFYKELGFTLDNECDIGTHLGFMSCGTCLLEIIAPEDKTKATSRPTDGIIGHICIEVKNIDEFVAEYKKKGIIPEDAQVMYNEKILGGIKNIFFDGPAGESIELFDYMK